MWLCIWSLTNTLTLKKGRCHSELQPSAFRRTWRVLQAHVLSFLFMLNDRNSLCRVVKGKVSLGGKKKKKACIEKPERECELHQSFCESSGRPWLSRTEKVHLTCLCTGRPAGREKHRDHESSFLSEPLLNSYDQRWDLLGTVHWPFSNNTRALLCSLFYFLPIIKGRICPVGRVTSAARCHSEPALEQISDKPRTPDTSDVYTAALIKPAVCVCVNSSNTVIS